MYTFSTKKAANHQESRPFINNFKNYVTISVSGERNNPPRKRYQGKNHRHTDIGNKMYRQPLTATPDFFYHRQIVMFLFIQQANKRYPYYVNSKNTLDQIRIHSEIGR